MKDTSDRKTIGQLVLGNAASLRERAAIVSITGSEYTYSDLGSCCRQVADFLRNMRIAPGGRVAVLLPSGPETAALLVAVMSAATAVPLDVQHAIPEIEQRLRRLRVQLLIVGEDVSNAVMSTAERLGIAVARAVPGGSVTPTVLSDWRGQGMGAEEPQDGQFAFILQSSGTTGTPKLVPLTHENVIAAAGRVQSWYGLTSADRCLGVAPIWHSHGLHVTVLTPLLTGGSIAFVRDPQIPDPAEWFVKLQPSWYSAGPTLHRRIVEKVEELPEAVAGHRLRFAVSGGMPLPQQVADDVGRVLGVPLYNHYGSSETAQICSNLDGAAREGSVGRPASGLVAIYDEKGPVAPGTVGRILVRGPTVFPGYIDGGERNEAFRDGWFQLGDTGYLDEDGFLFLGERMDDIINRGSEKISPTEVEAALLEHPAVLEAGAFPIPHPRLGKDVAAAVVLRRGMQADAVELRRFLSSRLAPFKVPRKLVFVGGLPRGRTGKLQRFKLVGEYS